MRYGREKVEFFRAESLRKTKTIISETSTDTFDCLVPVPGQNQFFQISAAGGV